MNVQSNNFDRQWQDIGTELLKLTDEVGKSGWYIQGEQLKKFELRLATFQKSPFACGVANGLNALEIALRILGIQNGDLVLTTPLSAFATTLAIINTGGTPVFCDTDRNGNIDLLKAKELITKHQIKFFIPVHLYGNPLDLNLLADISHNTILIEDCAQAIGAQFHDRNVGSIAKASGLSFYPTKNLGAMGDAGALLVQDETLCKKAMSLRDYGQSSKYVHDALGYNSRLDELHASHLNYLLSEKLPAWTERRRSIAKKYLSSLKNVRCLEVAPAANPAWHLFPIFTEEKKELKDYLTSKKISATEHYPSLITEQACMNNIDYKIYGPLTVAEDIVKTELSLPIHPYMTDEEVDYVIQEVKSWKA